MSLAHLSSNRLPVLVTGVTGVAGFNAFDYLAARYPGQVVGLRPPQTWQMSGPGIVALDTADADALHRLFDEYGFRSVLNATGNCALKPCELAPEMARRINVASASHVADNVRRHGCRLVHLSSDLVFSGTLGRAYHEADATDPVTVYGKTMREAEGLLSERLPASALLRISLPMGPSFSGHAGAIDWIQSRFRNGRPATLYFDEVRSCTYTDDLNVVFEAALDGHFGGVYHCGGPRALTLFQIGQVVNRVGGYEASLLRGCPRAAAGPIPPRAGDCTIDSAKLYSELGGCPFVAWPMGDEFPPDSHDWHHQRGGDAEGSPAHLEARLYRYPGARIFSGTDRPGGR